MNLFVDTSALVKLYHHEVGTDNFTSLLNQHADDLVITIADLTRIEIHSAFLKRVRRNEFALETVGRVFEAFDKDLQMFSVVEVDSVVNNFALQFLDSIAYRINLRTLDAIQLAAAIVSHQGLSVDYFVVCDKSLLNVARYYFSTFNPEVETIKRD